MYNVHNNYYEEKKIEPKVIQSNRNKVFKLNFLENETIKLNCKILYSMKSMLIGRYHISSPFCENTLHNTV